MKNINDSAFPIASFIEPVMENKNTGIFEVRGPTGLSKREYFAGLAMQGQLSFSPRDSAFDKAHLPNEVARVSVEMADALLKRIGQKEAETNAHLIAAAPGLLLACQGMLNVVRLWPHVNKDEVEAYLVEVIAKAEGKTS